MFQNMLLDRVVTRLLLKDDSPLAIRNNHGTIQIASVFGANWKMHEDDYPWIEHCNSLECLRSIVDSTKEVNFRSGILSRSLETLKFYNRKLNEYPICAKAIQISMPDLQGPLDTAEQLWGSELYYAFYDS